MKVIRLLKKLLQLVRRYGVRNLAARIMTFDEKKNIASGQIDLVGNYRHLQPMPPSPNVHQGTAGLLWFIPDFNAGSGGHLNIFRIIYNLERLGYSSTIVIVRPVLHHDSTVAASEIREHFFPVKADVIVGVDNLPKADFAIATAWDTAYDVNRFHGAREKIYFVQDFEPHFFPLGTEYVLAENTYRFGFKAITAGSWLSTKLANEYRMRALPIGFGVEHERYKPTPRREPHIKRVFFYARPPTPRRAFELGVMILNQVHRRMPDVAFILAGWDVSNYKIPFPHLACGTVPLDKLPDLYSQCDVALVLSLTNASLLPLELMACGCAVVSNDGPNVEWLLNDDVCELATLTPDALADAICRLLTDDQKRGALIASAMAHVERRSWDGVTAEFEAALKQLAH